MKFIVKGSEYGAKAGQYAQGKQFSGNSTIITKIMPEPVDPNYYWSVNDSGTELIFSATAPTNAGASGILKLENIDNVTAPEQWWTDYHSTITTIKFNDDIPFSGTSMGLFMQFSNLTSIVNLEKMDITNVTSLYGTFLYVNKLSSIDLTFLQKAQNVKDFTAFLMIDDPNDASLTTITNFDKANFADEIDAIGYFLGNQKALTTELDFSPLFSKVKSVSNANVASVFYNLTCPIIFNSPVTLPQNCAFLFENYCGTVLNLGNLDFSSIVAATSMFSKCTNLQRIYVDPAKCFNLDNIVQSNNMFMDDAKLPHFDSTKVDKTYAYIDNGTTGYLSAQTYWQIVTNGDDVKLHFSTTKPAAENPGGLLKLKDIDNSASQEAWYSHRSSITTIQFDERIAFSGTAKDMFSYFTNLTSIVNLENMDISEVTSLQGMFRHTFAKLNTIDLTFLQNAQNVKDFAYFLTSNDEITGLITVTNFDKANFGNGITDISYFISRNPNLTTELDYSALFNNLSDDARMMSVFHSLTAPLKFNSLVRSFTSYKSLFSNYMGIELDLTNFDLSQAVTTASMFGNCENLQHIYVDSAKCFDLDKITGDSRRMFIECTKLPHYDLHVVNKTYAYIDNGTTGYLSVKT